MMGAAGKLAASGALAGLLAAMTIMASLRQPIPAFIPAARRSEMAPTPSLPGKFLMRCRTFTVPDPACEAAWDAERRHFFGSGDR